MLVNFKISGFMFDGLGLAHLSTPPFIALTKFSSQNGNHAGLESYTPY